MIEEELPEEPLYLTVKSTKRRFKTSDLPPGSQELWRGRFVTTAYWWIGTLDKPWRVDPSLLCQVLQTIWDEIYDIAYQITVDGAIYYLVIFYLSFLLYNADIFLL